MCPAVCLEATTEHDVSLGVGIDFNFPSALLVDFSRLLGIGGGIDEEDFIGERKRGCERFGGILGGWDTYDPTALDVARFETNLLLKSKESSTVPSCLEGLILEWLWDMMRRLVVNSVIILL